MSEAKHTPGPWWVERHPDRQSLQVQAHHRGPDSSFCVASTNPYADDQEADARLIAAAPEMFEALKKLSALYNGIYVSMGDEEMANCRAAWVQADAALAKADSKLEAA